MERSAGTNDHSGVWRAGALAPAMFSRHPATAKAVALRTSLLLCCTFAISACDSRTQPPQQVVAVTRQVGSWEGRGDKTVGDVTSETGRFRIHWETFNESPAGAGRFKLTMRSAISGRTLHVVTDHKGNGTGHADFDEGPRTYDFLVESDNVEWKFRVDETSGAYSRF